MVNIQPERQRKGLREKIFTVKVFPTMPNQKQYLQAAKSLDVFLVFWACVILITILTT